MMRQRTLIAIVAVFIVLVLYIQRSRPSDTNKTVITDLNNKLLGRLQTTQPTITDKVLLKRLNKAMKISTTPAVEEILISLGFYNRTTPSGDFIYPDLPDHSIETPDVPTIVTAASSDHFLELQALFFNIDAQIRPIYPNLKVIVYGLELKETEEAAIIKYGLCEYRRFEFEKYPEHLKNLQTGSWKSVVIQIVLNTEGFVLWLDTSIRFNNKSNIQNVFKKVKHDGHLLCSYPATSPYYLTRNTYARTFEFFKEEVSVFHGKHEVPSGVVFMVKNNLFSYVLMRTWLTCLLQKECVMPKGTEHRFACAGPQKDHMCHRGDQSALGIACSLLYPEGDKPAWFPNELYTIHRGTKMEYFKSLVNHKP